MAEDNNLPGVSHEELTRQQQDEIHRQRYREDFAVERPYQGVFGTPLMSSTIAGCEGSFQDFMMQEEVRRDVRWGRIGCLADAILAWLVEGDACQCIPSYELYLQAVIHIIAIWNGEGGSTEGSGPYPHDLWTPRRAEELDPDAVRARESGEHVEIESCAILPTILRPLDECETGIDTHPAFQRETFEFAQHRHRTGTLAR